MPHQIGDPLNLLRRQAGVGQKCPDQRNALLLLIFSVGIAVLFPAQRAGDVMGDGGGL